MKLFIVAVIVLLLAFFGHKREMGERSIKEYCVSLFKAPIPEDRKTYFLDYARVIATIGVLLTHACAYERLSIDIAPWQNKLLSVGAGIGLICNPLYIMISGALLLPKKFEGGLIQYYKNRFLKVVMPFLVTYSILIVLYYEVDTSSIACVPQIIGRILKGASAYSPHLWIMYVFIALYITAPFVAIMLQNLNDSQINTLFVLVLIEELASILIIFFKGTQSLALDLAGWQGIFMLGYIIVHRRTKPMERFVLIASPFALVLIGVLSFINFNYAEYTFNTSPVMVVLTMAILVLLQKKESVFKKRRNLCVQTAAKYSFTMLMLHWRIMFVQVVDRFSIMPSSYNCIGLLIIIVMTFILCLLVAMVYDNTVIIGIRNLLSIKLKRK